MLFDALDVSEERKVVSLEGCLTNVTRGGASLVGFKSSKTRAGALPGTCALMAGFPLLLRGIGLKIME